MRLLQDEDRHAVVGRPLLGEGGEIWEDDLGFWGKSGEGDGGAGRGDGDVDSEVVAPVIEGVGGGVWDIWGGDDNADEAFAFVEGLDVESGELLANAGIDEFAGRDVLAAEGEGDFGGDVEVRQDVRDEVHLGHALHDDEAFVGAPFLLGEVAVDWAVHVSYCAIVSFT